MTFPEWLQACDRECIRITGLDLDSVCGDTLTRDAYEDGVTPAAHVADALDNCDFLQACDLRTPLDWKTADEAHHRRTSEAAELHPIPDDAAITAKGSRPIPRITTNYLSTPSDWRTNPPADWTPRPRLLLEES